jgi:serine/threonine protein kinase
MPTCPECHSFLLAPGRCPRDNKPLLDDTEAKKRGIIGKIAERYHVQELLGEGGMGSVFLAMHEQLQRKVAIKILRKEGQMEEQAIARFKREAKATSLINHRHVISVLDFGELPDHSAFYVMEHLEGKSLADAVDTEAPFTLPRALSIAVQVAKGLKAAHDKGVVHRDLKPDNIFLVAHQELPDFVKILDFGVAKIVSESQQLTKDGMLLGTPDYMAPEQAIGMPTDLRVDVYALGIMLYEMITGVLPFTGQTFMEVLSQHIHNAPPFISQQHPEIKIPAGVDEFIQKALKKRPENRFQTMEEVLDALFAISNIQGMLPSGVQQMSMVGMPAVPMGPTSKKVTALPSLTSKKVEPNHELMSKKASAIPERTSRRMSAAPPGAESIHNENTYIANPPRSVPSGAYPTPAKSGQIAQSANFSTLPKALTPRSVGSATYQVPPVRTSQAPQPNSEPGRGNVGLQTISEDNADLQSTRAFIQQAKQQSPVPNLFDSLEETNLFDEIEEGTADWSSRQASMEDDATHAAGFAPQILPPEKKALVPAESKPSSIALAIPKPEPRATEAPKPQEPQEPQRPQEPPTIEKLTFEIMSVPLAIQPPTSTPSSTSKWAALGVAFVSFLVMGVILYFLVVRGS